MPKRAGPEVGIWSGVYCMSGIPRLNILMKIFFYILHIASQLFFYKITILLESINTNIYLARRVVSRESVLNLWRGIHHQSTSERTVCPIGTLDLDERIPQHPYRKKESNIQIKKYLNIRIEKENLHLDKNLRIQVRINSNPTQTFARFSRKNSPVFCTH